MTEHDELVSQLLKELGEKDAEIELLRAELADQYMLGYKTGLDDGRGESQ